MSQWQVYMLRTAAGLLYTGISTDPQRRLREHEGGRAGARSLRGKGPLQLVWLCPAGDRAEASRIEYRLKRCSKARKEALIAGLLPLQSLLPPDPAIKGSEHLKSRSRGRSRGQST